MKRQKNLEFLEIKIEGNVEQNFYESFLRNLILKHAETLKTIYAPTCCYSHIKLPSVNLLHFTWYTPDTQNFDTTIQQILKNMKKIKVIELELLETSTGGYQDFANFIITKYRDHIVRGNIHLLEFFPFKIVTDMEFIDKALSETFSSEIEYFYFCSVSYSEPNEYGWLEYAKTFPKYESLKGISLNHHIEEDFLNLELGRSISEECQLIWKERVLYIRDILEKKIFKSTTMLNSEFEINVAKQNKSQKQDPEWVFRLL